MRVVFSVFLVMSGSLLFAQEDWTEQRFLNTNATSDSELDDSPRVASNGQGVWVAVWQSNEDLGGIGDDSDILFARSLDNGLTWSAPGLLNTNAASDSGTDTQPFIAFGMNKFIVVWTSNENVDGAGSGDTDILISVSTDFGVTWTSPEALNQNAASDTAFDWEPYIATDGLGVWMLGWYTNEDMDGSGSDTDIFIQTSTNNGVTWSGPSVLTNFMRSDTGSDFRPRFASDGAGVWGLVFESPNSLNNTIGTDTDVLFMRSLDNGFSWSEPAPVNSNAAVDTVIDNEHFIATDGDGNWIITWSSDDENASGVDWDIYLSRSTDGGLNWSDQALLENDVSPGSDFGSSLVYDGIGTWAAIWWNLGLESDIFYAFSDDTGLTWTPDLDIRMDTLTESNTDSVPFIATDGAGNLVVVWRGTIRPEGGTDHDILVASSLAPPPCQLSQTFFDALPQWPTSTIEGLIDIVNTLCEP